MSSTHTFPADQRRVLVGVDGSDDGLRAVRYGARSVLRDGGLLHLVHVVDDAVLAGAWGVVYDPSALQEAGQQAVVEAARVAREVGVADEQVRTEVVLGNGSAVLVRLSEGADLLVAGRRSVSGLERMFVGSTSVAVADSAKCPVLVISAAANPEKTGEKGRLAVGIDARSHSSSTLEWAFTEAAARSVPLDVVHVAGRDQRAAASGDLDSEARRGIEAVLTPLRERHPDVEATVVVTPGDPVSELVAFTERVDLLVMGVQDSGFLGIRLGGVMRAVLAHAHCPVTVVH